MEVSIFNENLKIVERQKELEKENYLLEMKIFEDFKIFIFVILFRGNWYPYFFYYLYFLNYLHLFLQKHLYNCFYLFLKHKEQYNLHIFYFNCCKLMNFPSYDITICNEALKRIAIVKIQFASQRITRITKSKRVTLTDQLSNIGEIF